MNDKEKLFAIPLAQKYAEQFESVLDTEVEVIDSQFYDNAIVAGYKASAPVDMGKLGNAYKKPDSISIQFMGKKGDPCSFAVRFESVEIKRIIEKYTIDSSKEKFISTLSKNTKSNLDKLYSLIGLQKVKEEITTLTNYVNIQNQRVEAGLPATNLSLHLVFAGNPGTGKTTVARLIAEIYKSLGVITGGQLIEVSRSTLVAGYEGQTAIKTKEVIDKAIGGVLFIDEAYTLVDKDNAGFGQEAIDTLLKEMEDHRDNLVVIIAGYDKLITEFIDSNPGLKSRFSRYIHFDDYNASELTDLFMQMCEQNSYNLDDNYYNELTNVFESIRVKSSGNFGNAREIRNFFESVITNLANRVSNMNKTTKEALSTIVYEDIQLAVKKYM